VTNVSGQHDGKDEPVTTVTPAESQADLTKQFDMATDIAKALLTLATGVLTLTITFSHDLVTTVNGSHKGLLEWGWGLFFGSIFGGVWLLYAANGSVSNIAKGTRQTIYDKNVAIPMALQQVTFVVGIVLMGIYGITAY